MLRRTLLLLLLLGAVARAQTVDERMAATLFALRVGDYEGAQQFMAALYQEKAPATPEWAYLYGPDGLAPLYLSWGRGDYQRVLSEGARAAERAQKRGDAEHELALRLLVTDAAYQAGLPARARQELPRLKALPAREGPRRFLVATYLARDAYLSGGGTWEGAPPPLTFGKPDPGRDLIELGLLPSALDFWQERLLERGRLEAARALYEKDVLGLLRGVPDYEKLQGPAFWNAVGLYWQTALVADVVALDFYRRAELPVAQEIASLRKHVGELEAQKRSVKDLGGLFPCLLHGRLGLALAQAHDALAQAMLSGRDPGSFSPAETEAVLSEIAAAATEAAETSDQRLVSQIQLDYVRALWYARPEGWQKELEDTLNRVRSPYRPQQIQANAYLGRLRALQGRQAEALTALEQAVSLLESYLVEAGGAGYGQRTRAEFQDVYELLARLQLEAGKPEEALEAFDRRAQLETAMRFRPGRLEPQSPARKARLARAVELQQQVQAAEGSGGKLLADSKEAFYKLLDEIQKSDPSYTRLAVRPNNFSRLQRFVPPGAAIVSIFPADTKTYLFVMTKTSLKIREVPVGRPQLDQWVKDFRREVLAFSRNPGKFGWTEANGQALLKPLTALSGALVAPLREDLKDLQAVAFIPTGSLLYFPLQCLLLDGKPTLLIEKYQVITLTKSSDMDALMLPPNTEVDTLMALADPDGSLAGARTEAGQVAQVFSKSKVYVGPEATRDHLKTLEAGTDVVHLATHGLLDSKAPTNSYLLVAGQESKLTVTEIAGLDLTAVRLVTLSACQSALADAVPEVGADLASLADAFGFAGSPSLVASLWKVDDQATCELMTGFYKALAGNASRSEAMQTAQLAMLGRPERAHPFYWASFILVGDWR